MNFCKKYNIEFGFWGSGKSNENGILNNIPISDIYGTRVFKRS